MVGTNFCMTHDTGMVCSVSGFISELGQVDKVPITKACTAWTHPRTGEVFILEIHQALYFGGRMDHSLINPNQLRHHGITVQDNPYDVKKPIGIYDPVTEINIPMQAYGMILGAET